MLDWLLAFAHHLFVFAMVGHLFAEFVLVRPGMETQRIRQVAMIDIAYGVIAGLVLAVGIARLVFAAKGWAWYQHNPWFWTKMAAFAGVALASLPPTVRFLGWSRRLKADPAWAPGEAEILGVKRWMWAELLLLPVIFLAAAAMARFQGWLG